MSGATTLGPLTMRPETSADEEFRLALFAQSRPDLALLPEPVRASIVPMQFRAQIAGYRAQFPAARYDILERDGERVGRLVHDRSQNELHLIDIALLPALRNQGLGTAVLHALMNDARAAGIAMRLAVAEGNPAARRLYERLGFVAIERRPADTVMEWRGGPGLVVGDKRVS